MDKALVSKFLLPATHKTILKDDRFRPEFTRGQTIFMKRLESYSAVSHLGLHVLRLVDGGILIHRLALHGKIKGALKLYHHHRGNDYRIIPVALVTDIYVVLANFEKGVDFSRYAGLIEHVTAI